LGFTISNIICPGSKKLFTIASLKWIHSLKKKNSATPKIFLKVEKIKEKIPDILTSSKYIIQMTKIHYQENVNIS